MTRAFDCDQVDELAGAYAAGAAEPDEQREITMHLRTCSRSHVEVRELVATADQLPEALERAEPSPALRNRIMRTVASMPREPLRTPGEPARSVGRYFRSLTPRLALAAAAGALVAALALGVRVLQLEGQTAGREELLRAIATAESAHAVAGSAGRGLILDTPDGPVFVTAELAPPPPGHLYELWLLDAEGEPTPAGVFTPRGDGVLSLVPLEQDLEGFTTFAATAERERVEAPTTEPVLVGSLGS